MRGRDGCVSVGEWSVFSFMEDVDLDGNEKGVGVLCEGEFLQA